MYLKDIRPAVDKYDSMKTVLAHVCITHIWEFPQNFLHRLLMIVTLPIFSHCYGHKGGCLHLILTCSILITNEFRNTFLAYFLFRLHLLLLAFVHFLAHNEFSWSCLSKMIHFHIIAMYWDSPFLPLLSCHLLSLLSHSPHSSSSFSSPPISFPSSHSASSLLAFWYRGKHSHPISHI